MASEANIKIRDSERTRNQILHAAQQIFSTQGYAETGVREIASIAGSNPALVNRYFGSKLKLFEAALQDALDVRLITDLDKEDFGKKIVERFTLSAETQINPLPIMMFGSSDREVRDIVLKLLQQRIVEPLKHWFGTEDGEARAAQFMVIATGFFTFRDLLPLPAFTGTLDKSTAEWLENSFQQIVER